MVIYSIKLKELLESHVLSNYICIIRQKHHVPNISRTLTEKQQGLSAENFQLRSANLVNAVFNLSRCC